MTVQISASALSASPSPGLQVTPSSRAKHASRRELASHSLKQQARQEWERWTSPAAPASSPAQSFDALNAKAEGQAFPELEPKTGQRDRSFDHFAGMRQREAALRAARAAGMRVMAIGSHHSPDRADRVLTNFQDLPADLFERLGVE